MKAYSFDLRQKIIEVYNKGHISQRQLGKQFNVALSFVQKLLKQHRETGNIAAKVRTEQTPTKLNASELNVLRDIVGKNNDATLEEIRYFLAEETGVLISISTLNRMISRLNLTRKKNIKCYRKRNRKSSEAAFRVLGTC